MAETKEILKSHNPKNPNSDNMKQGWEIKKLSEVCELAAGGDVPKDNFSEIQTEIHQIPIYANGEKNDGLYGFTSTAKVTKPSITVAARGTIGFSVKRLKPFFPVVRLIVVTPIDINKLDLDFLDYALKTIDFKHSGSSIPQLTVPMIRDYNIPIPLLPEQQRIVSILDEAFAAIAKAKANAEQNLKNARELFESYLQGVFENGKWETKTIEMVCDDIFAGGDAPKNNYSLEPSEKHNIPIYANAIKDRGLYGYTDFARVTKPCVTIAARGSGTGHTELRDEPFLPIVRLIVCIPDIKQISTEFLKYTIDNLVIQRSGSAIPQLTVPMIKDYKIPVPSIEEQKLIIEKAETLKQQKENLENVYFRKIDGLEELKKSILQKAFAGELKVSESGLAGFKDEQDFKTATV